MSNSYIIGIDGGGTKTLGTLFDLHGNVIKSVIKGPSNISVTEQDAIKTIYEVIDDLIYGMQIPNNLSLSSWVSQVLVKSKTNQTS
jgi:N-acetylglucosamine kinase-like BadF-type ATPase